MMFGVLLVSLLVTTPVPQPTPGYARFCTSGMAVGPGSYVEGLAAQNARLFKASPATSAQVAEGVQAYLHLAKLPTVVARNVDATILPNTPPLSHEEVLVADLDASPSRWWLAHVDAQGVLTKVRVASEKEKSGAVSFPRGMAAYVLFNEVMGGDTPIQRQGCVAVYGAWFGTMPGVLPTLDRAVSVTPSQDPQLASRVRMAWTELGASKTQQRGMDLTRDTIRLIGPNPDVESIYHDPGLPGDGIGPIDVVRIGAGVHTYAIVYSASRIEFTGPFSGPFCVVGDTRCATYYSWP